MQVFKNIFKMWEGGCVVVCDTFEHVVFMIK